MINSVANALATNRQWRNADYQQQFFVGFGGEYVQRFIFEAPSGSVKDTGSDFTHGPNPDGWTDVVHEPAQ